MGVAKPVQVSAGKTDPSQIYIQITNKDIYRLNKKIDLPDVASLIASIQAANKVRLHNWTKVEKRAPRTSTAWAENAAIDDGSDSCLSGELSQPVLTTDTATARRHVILKEFKAKCVDASHEQLINWYGTKSGKAEQLTKQINLYEQSGDALTESWIKGYDKLTRVLEVVEQERNYAKRYIDLAEGASS